MTRILTQTIILQIALKLPGIMDLYCRDRKGDQLQNKRVQTCAGSDVFKELFRILAKIRPFYKLRHVQLVIFFVPFQNDLPLMRRSVIGHIFAGVF